MSAPKIARLVILAMITMTFASIQLTRQRVRPFRRLGAALSDIAGPLRSTLSGID